MKIYKLRLFTKWARKEGITKSALKEAIAEIEAGLFDANLRATVYKKLVARKGQGKRGAYRTLIAYKLADRAIFMYGFSKNEQENISSKDIDGLKKLAVHYMAAGSVILQRAVKLGELEEIT